MTTLKEYADKFVNELVEYDSIVNQFFLPMIKHKLNKTFDNTIDCAVAPYLDIFGVFINLLDII